jgi:hypothetical protein
MSPSWRVLDLRILVLMHGGSACGRPSFTQDRGATVKIWKDFDTEQKQDSISLGDLIDAY